MTIKEYKAMILLETGMKISSATAKAFISMEREHEAEAIALGKYDAVSCDTPRPLHSE